MTTFPRIAAVTMTAAALALAGCASHREAPEQPAPSRSAGEFTSDAALTAKVKTAIASATVLGIANRVLQRLALALATQRLDERGDGIPRTGREPRHDCFRSPAFRRALAALALQVELAAVEIEARLGSQIVEELLQGSDRENLR